MIWLFVIVGRKLPTHHFPSSSQKSATNLKTPENDLKNDLYFKKRQWNKSVDFYAIFPLNHGATLADWNHPTAENRKLVKVTQVVKPGGVRNGVYFHILYI